MIIIIISIIIGRKIQLPSGGTLLTSTAIAAIFSGIFLSISRRKAITQIIGYIILENGIYLVGVTLIQKSSVIFEFGILIDILTGVLLMVIVLNNINTSLKNVNTKNMKSLKE